MKNNRDNTKLSDEKFVSVISNEDVNTQDIDGFCRGSWEITNKYYNADVYLYGLKNKDRLTSKLEFHMEAVIIYFDSKLVSTFFLL